jgi:hypothetical protein
MSSGTSEHDKIASSETELSRTKVDESKLHPQPSHNQPHVIQQSQIPPAQIPPPKANKKIQQLQVPGLQPQQQAPPQSPNRPKADELFNKLTQLKLLKDQGLITAVEHEKRRIQLVDELTGTNGMRIMEKKDKKKDLHSSGGALPKKVSNKEKEKQAMFVSNLRPRPDFKLIPSENALLYSYNIENGGWHSTQIEVKIEEQHFARGSLRVAHHMWARIPDIIPQISGGGNVHDIQNSQNVSFNTENKKSARSDNAAVESHEERAKAASSNQNNHNFDLKSPVKVKADSINQSQNSLATDCDNKFNNINVCNNVTDDSSRNNAVPISISVNTDASAHNNTKNIANFFIEGNATPSISVNVLQPSQSDGSVVPKLDSNAEMIINDKSQDKSDISQNLKISENAVVGSAPSDKKENKKEVVMNSNEMWVAKISIDPYEEKESYFQDAAMQVYV